VTPAVDFSPQASEYERYRVSYGQEVFDWKGGPAGPLLELACRTGLSTEPPVRLARGSAVSTYISPAL